MSAAWTTRTASRSGNTGPGRERNAGRAAAPMIFRSDSNSNPGKYGLSHSEQVSSGLEAIRVA